MVWLSSIIFSISFAAVDINKDSEKAPSKPLWNLKEMDAPESVYYDKDTQNLFISIVGGKPTDKDGNGVIVKATKAGKVLNAKWITELNAPKGLRSHGGFLWVTDINQVVKINIKEEKVESKIDVSGAKFLNDIAIDGQGVVYVSDTLGSRIYRIEADKVSVFIEGKNLESPNGLLIQGNQLVVAAWGYTEDFTNKTAGGIYSIGLSTKRIGKITKKPVGNLDGLELDHQGNFLVSDWVAGKIFKVKPNGKWDLLYYGFKGSADIAFIPQGKTLIVPRMNENMVTAYSLGQNPGY